MSQELWVGIEVARDLRLRDGALLGAGSLCVGGVNLLRHQVGIALRLAPAERVCLLSVQPDEELLRVAAENDLRELPPLDFVAMLRDRFRAGSRGVLVLLRQLVPLRSEAPVRRALEQAGASPALVSTSRPPAGHPRHQPLPGESEPDYRCLAFEVRRLGEQGPAFEIEDVPAHVDWEDFVEIIHPRDEAEAARRLASWDDSAPPGAC